MVTVASDVTKSIREFIDLLERGIKVEAVILYGSHAAGRAAPDSDIDIAVVSPDFEGMGLFRRQEMIADLTVDRPDYLSPIGYPASEYHSPGPHSFLREIIKRGRVVYEGRAVG